MSLENKLEFRTVYKTQHAFNYDKNASKNLYGRVINDETELFQLLSEMNLPSSLVKEYSPDFSKEIIVAVFQGQRTSGGYSIEITDIVNKKDNVVVCAQVDEPSGGIATMCITYPAHFVACPKVEKSIVFEWQVKDSYAEALMNCKRYVVMLNKKTYPKELHPASPTSRKERVRILKEMGKEIYEQLKKNCEEIGIQTDFKFLDIGHSAFMTLEETQVKKLEKRGYNVFKSV